MLALAEENAQRGGLTNLSFQEVDAHALPFPDEMFDRVTCRFWFPSRTSWLQQARSRTFTAKSSSLTSLPFSSVSGSMLTKVRPRHSEAVVDSLERQTDHRSQTDYHAAPPAG
jgi:hypothetical protein